MLHLSKMFRSFFLFFTKLQYNIQYIKFLTSNNSYKFTRKKTPRTTTPPSPPSTALNGSQWLNLIGIAISHNLIIHPHHPHHSLTTLSTLTKKPPHYYKQGGKNSHYKTTKSLKKTSFFYSTKIEKKMKLKNLL